MENDEAGKKKICSEIKTISGKKPKTLYFCQVDALLALMLWCFKTQVGHS